MTLPPTLRFKADASGVDMPLLYDSCYVSGCKGKPLDRHHIWPRSALGGDVSAVTVNGRVLGNLCLLCREHHRRVTGDVGGHEARLVLLEVEHQKSDYALAQWEPILAYQELSSDTLYPMVQPTGWSDITWNLTAPSRPKPKKSEWRDSLPARYVRWKMPAGIAPDVLEDALDIVAEDFGRDTIETKARFPVVVFDLVNVYLQNRHRMKPVERGE